MLSNKGFDTWANEYDKSVSISDNKDTYPFAGYKDVQKNIFQTIMKTPKATVLDIGFGTGTLTTRLYEQGCTIYGQDFSAEMIKLASEKMPLAHLYQGDFTQGLAEPLKCQKYDYIVATYSLHHLTDEQKIIFIQQLLDLLNENGKIIIGDVAFKNRDELDICREKEGNKWDSDEIYFVADELKKVFPKLSFVSCSYCSGILTFVH